MQSLAVSLILVGAALADSHPQGVKHIVLDMNVEVVSLLGEPLYRTLPQGGPAQKDLEAAFAEAEKHVAAQPENPAVYVELGQACEGLFRYHDAAQAYTKAISLTPDDGALFARRGYTFIVLRQFQQASNDFQHASAIMPANADAWRGLGLASYLLHDFEKAESHFREVIKANGNNDPAAVWMTFAMVRTDRGKDAPLAEPEASIKALGLNEYWSGLAKLKSDSSGALSTWKVVVEKNADWSSLSVIASEVEIAAIEGTKKMKPLNE